MLRAIVLVLALALLPVKAAAAEPSAVRRMMEHAGMVAEFAMLGETVRNSVALAPGDALPAEIRDGLADIAGRVMDGTALTDRVEAALQDSLSPAEIAEVDQFYASPLGVRLMQAEVRNADEERLAPPPEVTPERRRALEADAPRAAVYREMDKALRATDLSTSMMRSMLGAMTDGILETQPALSDEQREGFRAQADDAISGLMRGQADEVLADLARTYEAIPLADLQTYLVFLRTDAAQLTYATILSETASFLDERGKQIGRKLAALLRQRRT